MNIQGKTTLVTSTSSGIGKGIKLPHTQRITIGDKLRKNQTSQLLQIVF